MLDTDESVSATSVLQLFGTCGPSAQGPDTLLVLVLRLKTGRLVGVLWLGKPKDRMRLFLGMKAKV